MCLTGSRAMFTLLLGRPSSRSRGSHLSLALQRVPFSDPRGPQGTPGRATNPSPQPGHRSESISSARKGQPPPGLPDHRRPQSIQVTRTGDRCKRQDKQGQSWRDSTIDITAEKGACGRSGEGMPGPGPWVRFPVQTEAGMVTGPSFAKESWRLRSEKSPSG